MPGGSPSALRQALAASDNFARQGNSSFQMLNQTNPKSGSSSLGKSILNRGRGDHRGPNRSARCCRGRLKIWRMVAGK
jgi:hypothetical protein